MKSPGMGGAGAEDERGLGREALHTLKSALYERLAGENESRLRDILSAEFRSNPGYQIIELSRLSPTAQQRLRLDADADYFGVLCPLAGSDLEIKAVGRDIALLFYFLAEAGGLPDFITKDADEQVNSQIAGLVLDDILQIASGGEFVSGAGAHNALYERREAKRQAANRFSQSERLIAHYARRLDPAGALFAAGLPEPPISSINYGSGGVAYYFYRLAGIRQDAQLLSWAKLWIEKAIRESETKAQLAFWDLDQGLTPETVGPVALYHSPTGLHVVKALIGHAANDDASQLEGLAGFVKAARLPCDNIDLTLGRSGALLGAALLDEAMPGQPDLRSLGTQLLAQIWGQIDAMPQLAQETRFRYTGIAHGWAGVLYAALCWCAITGAPVPATLPDRLHQLADLAERWGDGMRWALLIPSGSDRDSADFSAGWCNGTAGMIHLWTRAYETIRDSRFLELADGAARHVIATPDPIAQLCCGRPGQAYALLNLYKHTGERRWLEHAHKFAEQSRCLSPPTPAAPPFHYALYKGPLGTALLSADIDDPSEACMPMFELQRWQAT